MGLTKTSNDLDHKQKEDKKVLMIIASDQFRDEEYKVPRQILEEAGCNITVASSSTNKSIGSLGMVVTPDITIEKVQVSNYHAIVFVGGMGAEEYFNNNYAHQIALEAMNSNLVVAAICIAPSILANAGVLEGKRATSYPSEHDNLISKRSICTKADVERDGLIITASGPHAAQKFGETILEALK